ncbi:HAMP domain-containing sensor histidine kinase [Streptomyces sp. NPDC048442]|uniref:HAMP domain-containing sensor histidine kinase n=1 Tax=Streptomyces sp. NPDC048442 TaxID=3154823 RepID=UPI0034460933
MTSLAHRLRTLRIRTRLALLVTTAVAVAVALSAAACWLLTQNQLRSELDNTLQNSRASTDYLRTTAGNCRDTAFPGGQTLPGSAYVQIVLEDGSRCVGPGSTPVRVQKVDQAVAIGIATETLHDGVDTDGKDVRVLTRRDPSTHFTVSISRPLSEIDTPLNNLALVLLLVAGLGIVGAGAAGFWVARTGLRPVDRLTEAVEHIARTEDLTVRIPLTGSPEDETARLSASFNAMTAALASSRDLQSQLIADAGHELRTPLTSLRTNIELLSRSEDTGRPLPPADRKALLASVKAQMTELAALITDLQELARPETSPGSPSPQVVSWHDQTRTALERARLRGPELNFDVSLAPWYVRAEPAALERALVNILDNAVKFSPPGGTVDVRLHLGTLTVRDHGPGIPPTDLPHVFERFWRSPSARALPGSGLGLSIVARTVREAGGEVSLRAPEDGGPGTEAVVRLPGAPTLPPSEVP